MLLILAVEICLGKLLHIVARRFDPTSAFAIAKSMRTAADQAHPGAGSALQRLEVR
jgi:hypothetical protein